MQRGPRPFSELGRLSKFRFGDFRGRTRLSIVAPLLVFECPGQGGGDLKLSVPSLPHNLERLQIFIAMAYFEDTCM